MQVIIGNIIEFSEGIICHGVNCQGVMGSGLAKQIRDKYPRVYQRYVDKCSQYNKSEKHQLLGTNQLCLTSADSSLFVCNMFTQLDYGRENKRYASYNAIDECMKRLAKSISDETWQDTPVYIPQIGCGLGGGDWNVVSNIIKKHLNKLDNVKIVLYEKIKC